MATRVYFHGQPLYPVTHGDGITPDAGWEKATVNVELATAFCGPLDELLVGFSTSFSSGLSGTNDLLHGLFQTPPLDIDQTITGTVKGQFKASENNAAANAMAQLCIRVIAPDGTVRGTLLALHSDALSSEYATTLTNRKFPLAALSPASLSSVDALAGDVIVIEVGTRKTEAGSTSRTYNIRIGGDNSQTDLAEDETSTANQRPWLEFSQDLTFAHPPRLSSLRLLGMGA